MKSAKKYRLRNTRTALRSLVSREPLRIIIYIRLDRSRLLQCQPSDEFVTYDALSVKRQREKWREGVQLLLITRFNDNQLSARTT